MHFTIDISNTLFVGITGSQAYGTNTPSSDLDVRGIVQTPIDLKLSTTEHFEQFQGDPAELRRALGRDEPWSDCTIYDVVKAAHLMAQCNPNMIELLWLPDRCTLYRADRWKPFVGIRDVFLSAKAQHTYSGYAYAQWRKIASHRSWLLDPPKAQPTRAEYGLPEMSLLSGDDRNRIEESIEAMLRGWGIEDLIMDGAERDVLRSRMHDFWATTLQSQRDDVEQELRTLAGASLGLSSQVLEILAAERKYRAALKHWNSFLRWKSERNAERAALESQFGFDTKHGMHLIRLLRMGTEILSGKGVRVDRGGIDAIELKAIRAGLYSYDQIDALAKVEMGRLEQAARSTALPKHPDLVKINASIVQLYLGDRV